MKERQKKLGSRDALCTTETSNEPLQLEISEIISQTVLRYTHAVDIKIYNIKDKK